MPEGAVVRWDARGGCCKVGCPRGLLESAMPWKGGGGDMECPRGPAMWSGVPMGAAEWTASGGS